MSRGGGVGLLNSASKLVPCHLLVLNFLVFIICFIEIVCPGILLTNLDPLISKKIEVFSNINLRLEYAICEKLPTFSKIIYHLNIIWGVGGGELDIYRIK